MRPPTEKRAATETVELLSELLGIDGRAVRVRDAAGTDLDYFISAKDHRFAVEYKSLASSGHVSNAVKQLVRHGELTKRRETPLLVVPFMGDVGRAICKVSGISWLDLSGNARITAPGLRIWVEGRPNRFSGPGRPPNLFAPKSSRVTRQLLLKPLEFQSQSELVRSTGLDDGYVSKIFHRLQQAKLLESDPKGRVRPRDPDLLLDAWHSVYDFGRHDVLKGHIAARSGSELLQRMSTELRRHNIDHAATGLGAAWLLTHFASFRITTVYLRSLPLRSVLEAIGFHDEPSGANTWLVIPNDEGVFQGGQIQEGINCVSTVQTYLDLKGHPERSKEAADEVRKQNLNWKIDAR
jgi:hypothetical protein